MATRNEGQFLRQALWAMGGLATALFVLGCKPAADSTATLPSPPEVATGGDEVQSPVNTAESAALAATPTTNVAASVEHGENLNSGANLYGQHCAACHGEKGDGVGPAAKFLYPKPRNLRSGQFRLVRSTNVVPTRQDIEETLVRGMPGSAMISWAHLSSAERTELVDQVLAFRREGARDVELKLAAEEELELSDDELAENVARVTTPADPLTVPEIAVATPQAIAHGKELYASKGCVSCHGATGKGDGQQQMIDNEGIPTRPRDLTLGIFKGNHDPASIFRRLWLGMPGTPMPASQQLTQQEVVDMVHFVLSLSDEPTRQAVVLRRVALQAAHVAALPGSPEDSLWAESAAVPLQTTPLWWRDEPDRKLTVQAVHDGQSIALLLAWNDDTHDDAAVRPDEFEDMAAVQLHQGGREPFLGMGAHGVAVDVWQWRAGTKNDGAERWQSDEYPFDTAVYRELFKDRELPDFVTARAAGNPLATREHSGASLAAAGFGSLTFRPHAAQRVAAQGAWSDGRWRVQMTRPLDPGAANGTPLAAGQKCSVAFALWDGAARDRAGQKLVTLWNDLTLE